MGNIAPDCNDFSLSGRDFIPPGKVTHWMPYVVELNFEGQEFRDIVEHGYVDKGK